MVFHIVENSQVEIFRVLGAGGFLAFRMLGTMRIDEMWVRGYNLKKGGLNPGIVLQDLNACY